MKYGKVIESKINPKWSQHYIDYKKLKDLIKECQKEAAIIGETSFSPRTTSLTVQRYANKKDSKQEAFFRALETDLKKVQTHTDSMVEDMRKRLRELSAEAGKDNTPEKNAELLQIAQEIGEYFLDLERYVNINYMGFHKILKKHDKCLPHAPCRQFYVAHLHQQPWVQGNYSDLLVSLSTVYSKLRGDTTGTKNEDAAQGFTRSTTKYWVRNEDVSTVKHHVLQHLPVFQFDKNKFAGDAQLVNSVYMDNDSMELYHGRLDKKPGALALRIRWYGNEPRGMVFFERKTHKESWKGEESVKERFTLPDDKVVAFMEGRYTLEMAIKDQEDFHAKKNKTMSSEDKEAYAQLFTEIYKAVDSKQLKPLIRTQYMRTAFQIPFDATVRVSLDTNLCMIKEDIEGEGKRCLEQGRWFRDPERPVHRTEITRFPHAVLEVKLSLQEGQTAPPWVQELIESGYLTEVHKFSKFIHGSATLYPDYIRACPYWFDDESVRDSVNASAPTPPDGASTPATGNGMTVPLLTHSRPRVGKVDKDQRHPLLGDQATLKLMPERSAIRGFSLLPETGGAVARRKRTPGFFSHLLGLVPHMNADGTTPMKLEPKTFFANERTFLAWLHMAVTLGSVAAALLGFVTGSDSSTGSEATMSRHLVELIALILLPLGVVMCCYALYTFIWRASNIAKKRGVHFDDRVGPLCLCACVVAALSAITLLSVIDLFELLENPDDSGPDAPTPSSSPATALGRASAVLRMAAAAANSHA